MKPVLRRADAADATSGVEVLRRSITDLCGADHGQDPKRLARWLFNKTEEVWAGWAARPDAVLLVAELDGVVRGVGMMTHAGDIVLNYVHPEARFRGLSKAMVAALEAEAAARGLVRCRLETTRTARDFYLSQGYSPLSGSDWMEKDLTAV